MARRESLMGVMQIKDLAEDVAANGYICKDRDGQLCRIGDWVEVSFRANTYYGRIESRHGSKVDVKFATDGEHTHIRPISVQDLKKAPLTSEAIKMLAPWAVEKED
jgi:hypothetical protein